MKVIAHSVTNLQIAQKAIKKGVDFLEIDVSKRVLSSKFIIQHNSLKGIFGVGPILETLLTAELKTRAFLDLKAINRSESFTYKLSQLLEKLKVENVKVCGHRWQMISKLSKKNNLLPYYTLKNKKSIEKFKKMLPQLKKATGFSVKHDLIDEDFMKEFKKKSVEIWAWTVNDANTAKKLEKLGVNGLITDQLF